MKGYVVCVYKSISSEEKLKEYAIKAKVAVEKYKGKFLIRGGKSTTNEGDKSPRTVVIEFSSYDEANLFYNSKEYGARGFFVDGFSSFASVKNESLQVSLGMTIGQKWVTTNGFSFELFVGLARYITDTVLEAHAPVGIAIGKRF